MKKPKKLKLPAVSKPLSQCPDCLAVEMELIDGRKVYQKSICEFGILIKKQCYDCKE